MQHEAATTVAKASEPLKLQLGNRLSGCLQKAATPCSISSLCQSLALSLQRLVDGTANLNLDKDGWQGKAIMRNDRDFLRQPEKARQNSPFVLI